MLKKTEQNTRRRIVKKSYGITLVLFPKIGTLMAVARGVQGGALALAWILENFYLPLIVIHSKMK